MTESLFREPGKPPQQKHSDTQKTLRKKTAAPHQANTNAKKKPKKQKKGAQPQNKLRITQEMRDAAPPGTTGTELRRQAFWKRVHAKQKKRHAKFVKWRNRKYGPPQDAPPTPGSKNQAVKNDGQRAAEWVETYLAAHGHGPEWGELVTAMDWNPDKRYSIIFGLSEKGWLTHTPKVHRSLRPGPKLQQTRDDLRKAQHAAEQAAAQQAAATRRAHILALRRDGAALHDIATETGTTITEVRTILNELRKQGINTQNGQG